MFIEIAKGDFIALDTIARVTYWTDDEAAGPSGCKRGFRVETKRGEKHSVTDAALVDVIRGVVRKHAGYVI
jgi:hypothetical protein